MIAQHQENSKTKVRGVAIFLLVVEVALMFVYGFGSEFDLTTANFPTTSDNSSSLIMYILAAILPILGWGLIIAYSENSAIAGLTTTLITVGIFVQLAPPVFYFWDYLFNSVWMGRIAMSLTVEVLVMYACTSMMVAFCFVSGRLGLAQTIAMQVVYGVGWTANYALITWLRVNKFSGIDNYDSIGANYVYLFAGIVGIIVSIFISFKPGRQTGSTGSRQSAFIGLIGTGFAFAAAPFSGFTAATNTGLYTGPLNIYFALTASVIMTYVSSAIFGNYKVGVRESLVGVLGGLAILGSVSSYINNIGACITVGALAGFVSGFWLRFAHPRINANYKYDQLGLIGPIMINAFIGTIFIAPIAFAAYSNQGLAVSELVKTVTQSSSTYYLAVFCLTLALAVLTGLAAGALVYLLRDPEDDYNFTKLISNDYGLYVEGGEDQAAPEPGVSASHLHNNNQNPKENAL